MYKINDDQETSKFVNIITNMSGAVYTFGALCALSGEYLAEKDESVKTKIYQEIKSIFQDFFGMENIPPDFFNNPIEMTSFSVHKFILQSFNECFNILIEAQKMGKLEEIHGKNFDSLVDSDNEKQDSQELKQILQKRAIIDSVKA